MVKERIHWIDVSKGILILLLLLHHFASAKRVMGIDSNFFSFLTCWQSLYTAFFMQAFLMMSGYCSNFKKPHGQFWEGVIKQLVIPFIFFEFISCCIISAQKEDFSINGIFQVWTDTNGTTLWFLNALIVSKVLIYYMRRVTKSVKVALMITFVFLSFAVYGIINVIQRQDKAITTNAIPITNKIVVVDAGHGKPDERRNRF